MNGTNGATSAWQPLCARAPKFPFACADKLQRLRGHCGYVDRLATTMRRWWCLLGGSFVDAPQMLYNEHTGCSTTGSHFDVQFRLHMIVAGLVEGEVMTHNCLEILSGLYLVGLRKTKAFGGELAVEQRSLGYPWRGRPQLGQILILRMTNLGTKMMNYGCGEKWMQEAVMRRGLASMTSRFNNK